MQPIFGCICPWADSHRKKGNWNMPVTIKEIKGSELDELTRQGKVLAIFYSTTCGPCKMLRFVLKDIARDVEAIEIVEIDFDKSQETIAKYAVEGYPTILFFQDGLEKARLKGLQQKPVLLKLITADMEEPLV